MAYLLLSVQFLLLIATCSASHFYGGSMKFVSKGRNPDGSFKVDLHLKQTYRGCTYANWKCVGNSCGNEERRQQTVLENYGLTTPHNWCETEIIMSRKVPNNIPFDMRTGSCCWISTVNYIGSWILLGHVDLGTRSDTKQPNRSPDPSVVPLLRIPVNCPRSIQLMAVDPDGDQVRCRYGTNAGTECNACSMPTGFSLNGDTCVLYYSQAQSGTYGFEMVVEDFPKRPITLFYTNGASTNRSPLPATGAKTSTTNPVPLSKLPWHFTLVVEKAVPSCSEGLYLPRFVHPTPHHGDHFDAQVNEELEIKIRAQASHSQVKDILLHGPTNATKSKTKNGEFVIRWTPASHDLGEQFPICFVAEATKGSSNYQTGMRCVLVKVKHVKAKVICSETSMTVQVEKSTFKGLSEDHLQLNEPGNTVCSLQTHSNATHVIGIVPLNACGTEIEEDDDNLIFKNEITTVDNATYVITRKHLLAVDFYCQYLKHGNVSLGFTVHRDNLTISEKAFGTFTYVFEFYPDNRFSKMVDPSLYPLEYDVGDDVYMQIEATSSVNNTELFVESCRASPYDNPNYSPTYPIIENGCDVDPTVLIYSPRHIKQFRFSIEAFKFIGLHDQVYISCSLILCEAGNPSARCSQGCVNATSPWYKQKHHRRKREAIIQTGAHFISQGPLRLRRNAKENRSQVSGLNLNLVFIAGCLLAVFGMICAVVIYKAKKGTVKYERLSTAEH